MSFAGRAQQRLFVAATRRLVFLHLVSHTVRECEWTDGFVFIRHYFAFSNFLPIGLCNFNLSPLWGGLISCLFFVPWPFLLVLPFILGVVGGVVF